MSKLILSVCPQGAKSKDGTYNQFSLRVDNPPNRSEIKKLFINLFGVEISDKNGWIPDEFALYYLENWHGRIIDDILFNF